MKKNWKLITGGALALTFFLAKLVRAADYGLTKTAAAGNLPSSVAGGSDVPGLVGVVVSAVLGLMAIIFFVLIIYAGLNWMLARGNTEKIEKSKDVIIDAAIGLVIVSAAWGITNFVFQNIVPDNKTSCGNASPGCAGLNLGDTCTYQNKSGVCIGMENNCACDTSGP